MFDKYSENISEIPLKTLEGAMDSDPGTDKSLLDEMENNVQLTCNNSESNDKSKLSYTSQLYFLTLTLTGPSSRPITPGAVLLIDGFFIFQFHYSFLVKWREGKT